VVAQLVRGSVRFDWRGWFLIGIVVGGMLFAVLGGGAGVGGYGWLTGTSMLSPASLVATATFFGAAIIVSFVIEAVI